MLKKLNLVSLILFGAIFSLTACSTIPGETQTEQIQTIDELVESTLTDLYKQSPEAQKPKHKLKALSVMPL